MAIRVKCPNPACGKEHNLKVELAGKTVRCSFCQQVFTVPTPSPGVMASGAIVATKQSHAVPPKLESPDAKLDPLIGKQIAYYRIESALGKGGMGKVYKAQNLRLAKTCAIKILPPEAMAEDPTLAERFIREARAAAAVQHPNVLPVQNVAKVEENYFIEMDYVDGGTLHGLMRQRGRLDVKEAARIIRDAAAGLAAAHKKGIIHRDIKPSNIMLTAEGHVFVMDFGLAKAVQSKSGLTQQGYILGTPWYMSPEQAMAQPADQRSDIYSLGVMFYQILTGSPPYTADSPVALLLQHKEAPIPDITQALPGCPVFIAAMIRKMMAKDPAERYQSCAEVVNELNAFLSAPPGTMTVTDSLARRPTVLLQSKRIGAKKRSTAPVTFVLVLVLLLVLGGVAYFVVKGKKSSVPPSTPGTETAQGRVAHPPSGVQAQAEAPVPHATGQVAPAPAPATPSTASKEAVPPASPSPQGGREGVGVANAQPSPLSPLPPGEGQGVRAPGEAAKRAGAASQGVRAPAAQASVDLLAYLEEVKPVNEKIEAGDYKAAETRANLLKDKYPDLVGMKVSNIGRIVALRKRCIERINSGAAKLTMGDVSKRYAFAGEVKGADDTGLTAAIKKGWDAFNKEEMLRFYRKASDPKSAEDVLAIAAFVLEGSGGEKAWDQALDVLGEAKALNADIAPQLKYIETLKRAAKEYAEAEARGKQLATAESAESAEKGKEGQVTARSGPEGATRDDKGTPSASSAPSAKSAVKSFDDVYVTTAATGEKIPHPLSKKTTKLIYQGKKIDVPEGMVYVPAGKFKMGVNEREHEVYLDAYFIGKYEVTNAEWKAFVDAKGFTLPQHWKGGTIPEGKDNHPVVYVSWENIQNYCEWVSNETGNKVSLPTEAQWEKAARGPKGFQYPWGNDWNPKDCNWQGTWVAKYGLKCNPTEGVPSDQWLAFTKTDKYTKEICAGMGGMTMPIGSFPKGKCFYGCCDMAGNASEWCQDWFTTNYYKLNDARKNPAGPTEEQAELVDISGKKYKARVVRGGNWATSPSACRTVNRARNFTSARIIGCGFRVGVSLAR